MTQKVVTGDQGMIGLVGVADSDVHRSGRIKVRGEYWEARSDSPVKAGRPVRVVGIDNLTVKVEEVNE
jgi:membrane-bound serine protease (ClpP class)